MSEVQGTIEFAVELHKFYNVDLFQRGFYQIRTSLKIPPRIPHRVTAALPGPKGKGGPGSACVQDSAVHSQPFQILYRNEEVPINIPCLFRVHLLLDGDRVEEALNEVNFELKLDLHFTESEPQLGEVTGVPLISSRRLSLHFHLRRGLHHHVPAMFDYFHLSVISVTLHATLVALHQPLISFPRLGKGSWLGKTGQEVEVEVSNQSLSLENLVFGSSYYKQLSVEGSVVSSECCVQQACRWHQQLCHTLLSAYRGLFSYYTAMLQHIPALQRLSLEDCRVEETLSVLCTNLQELSSSEKMAEQISRDLEQLCSHLTALWTQFLESVTLQPDVTAFLTQEHHTLRVKRFSEAFFYMEHKKEMALTFQEHLLQSHHQIAAAVRSSAYLTSMPPLPAECLQIDGDWSTLPIIFEDRFVESLSSHNQPNDTNEPTEILTPEQRFRLEPVSSERLRPGLEMAPGQTARPEPIDVLMVKLSGQDGERDGESHSLAPSAAQTQAPEAEVDQERTVTVETECGHVALTPCGNQRLDVGRGLGGPAEPCWGAGELGGDGVGSPHTSGLTFIEVRPSSTDPYRGEAVLVMGGGESEGGGESRGGGKSEGGGEGGGECKGAGESEGGGEGQGPGWLWGWGDSGEVTRSEGDEEERERGGLIKRSLSVISDSGIGSELGSRGLVPQHQAQTQVLGRSGVSSQGGGSSGGYSQTEVCSSLPSGIQASLTSISSLPFEGEEEEVEEGREEGEGELGHLLTKSASAPHISTSELEGEGEGESEGDREAETEGSPVRCLSPRETMELDGPVGGLSLAGGPSLPVTDYQDGQHCHQQHLGGGLLAHHHHHHPPSGSASGQGAQKAIGELLPARERRQAKEEGETDGHKLCREEAGAGRRRTEEEEGKAQVTRALGGGKAPVSVATINATAGEKRNVVEVVNLSVSCAATCLPFSSMLRDSPRNANTSSSFPARHLSSPVTRQPVGSFGIANTDCQAGDEDANERMLSFFQAKEELMAELCLAGSLYSDPPVLASTTPYFTPEEEDTSDPIHLVVCVHGLDGNNADLRLVKTFIELGLPGAKLDFLMSERNQSDTFADFDAMTDRLLDEIIQHIHLYNLTVSRISFIGHSLGNIIIRSLLTRPRFRCYLRKLHTFLSLSGPHLGTLYNNSTLVSTGLWLMQKLKKSGSLLQLTFRDQPDPRKTFLYKLSEKPGLQHFKNVVLMASTQDRYVPFHSARIEICKTALKDRQTGSVYTEMINNLLQPVAETASCTLVRYDIFHALPNTANALIGRAAHIAVLDSELFLEKFLLVAGLHYFK